MQDATRVGTGEPRGGDTNVEASLSYVVGVDLGTTFSAAAIGTGDRVETFNLGSRVAAIPSVVVLRADGTVLVGEAAERRAVTEAARTAREFKRRLGDPTPFLLGGTPYGAEALTGHLLAAILGQIAEQFGGDPDRVTLTHPANYGEYKLGYLEEAARLAGVGDAAFISEPVAAAAHYADGERLATGEHLAVYDFGGGTLDIAVVTASDTGFELIGNPEGMDRFGGVDLDESVFFHVQQSLGSAAETLDPCDPATTAALAALRSACRDAKEALSADTDTTIPVMLPSLHTEVRITRAEFEDMLRPRLRDTIPVLERVVASAGAGFEDLSRILLVGGASRIPLVADMIRQETGRPVAIDANPKHAVALGAARLALGEGDAPGEPTPVEVVVPDPVPEPEPTDVIAEPAAAAEPEPVPEPAPRAGPEVEEAGDPERSRGRPGRRTLLWLVVAVVAAAAAVAIVLAATGVFGGQDSIDDTAAAPDDVDERPPVGWVYFRGFGTPELDGDWVTWSAAGAQPPDDIGSDYYPLAGPYSSREQAVMEQHMAWLQGAGADLLFVEWPGNEHADDELMDMVLDTADRSGLRVAAFLDVYPGRSPMSVAADVEHLAARFGDHPAWYRSTRATPWNEASGLRVVLIAAPEMTDDGPGLGPEDWIDITEHARGLEWLSLAVSPDSVWIEAGRFDGLAGAWIDDSFDWVRAIPDEAWFVPSVFPGLSTDRIGGGEVLERGEGSFFEAQWRALGQLDRRPDMVIGYSFNGWHDGSQIEPARSDPPDPRYRTYEPLGPEGYIDLAHRLTEEGLGSGG